ncbi:MAG: AraC family transcriptional regulator [Clostridiales bacterium]|nr:AraC family transcriptional regulator [Clostridiales bacterium]
MLPVYEIRKSDLTVKYNNYELTFPEHMHKYIEIVYVYKGVQHVKIDDCEYAVTEGCAAAVFPDTVHSFFCLDKKESEVLILMCEPKLFGKLFPSLEKFSPETPFIETDLIPDELRTAFNCISPDNSFEIKFSWTCVIMSYILDILNLRQQSAMPVSDITYKIIKYVEENFTEQITRTSLAEHFNVSECYISRIFTQKFKMNLRSYLGLIRAEYAANLIRTTNETFTVISQLTGFESQRTFNRVFRAVYGSTPQEYKNNINRFIK